MTNIFVVEQLELNLMTNPRIRPLELPRHLRRLHGGVSLFITSKSAILHDEEARCPRKDNSNHSAMASRHASANTTGVSSRSRTVEIPSASHHSPTYAPATITTLAACPNRKTSSHQLSPRNAQHTGPSEARITFPRTRVLPLHNRIF
jgi:hypothetical protein